MQGLNQASGFRVSSFGFRVWQWMGSHVVPCIAHNLFRVSISGILFLGQAAGFRVSVSLQRFGYFEFGA